MRLLVTGASSGIGRGAALALARDGHEVVVHARGADRLNPDEWAAAITGDLADFNHVRQIAGRADDLGPFDAVIHNAGTMHHPDVFAVNVVAPYALTALMRRPARLIYLSSSMHRGGSADLARIEQGQVTYSDSKLYVTALALAFARRWPETASHAVDPGWVPTKMGGPSAPDDLTAGHETQVWLATGDPDPATGGYWHHKSLQQPHPLARDTAFQTELISRLTDHCDIEFTWEPETGDR